MKIKRLNTGDAAIGEEEHILFTGGIGSCVVICLWDQEMMIGGMAHMPHAKSEDSYWSKTAFGIAPDVAIPYLIEKMVNKGARLERMCIRLIGGGNMFPDINSSFMQDVGQNIIIATLKISNIRGLQEKRLHRWQVR